MFICACKVLQINFTDTVIFVKLALTIFLVFLISLCFSIFYDCIREHLKEAKAYMIQRENARKKFEDGCKEPDGWYNLTQSQINYLNHLAKAYCDQKEIVKNDVTNLLKTIIAPLGALSIMWFGKPC